MQKKAIRAICNANYTAHTEPLFKEMDILPLDKLVVYTQGMLTHSIVHQYSPPALHGQWDFNHQRNHIELRNNKDMYVPLAVTDYIKKMPFFALAINWNALPAEKMYPNKITFKISLLDHLKNNW
jgi:hypothetical protein